MSLSKELAEETAKWNRTHYHAYLLVWAAHVDLGVSEEEIRYIKGAVGPQQYRWAEGAYQQHSDYESIQIISENRRRFYPAETDKMRLESDIRTLFSSDHEWNTLEDTLLSALKKVL